MSLADYLPSWMVKKQAPTDTYQVSTTATQQVNNPFGVSQSTQQYGPFTNAPDQSFEFSDPGSYFVPINKAAKSVMRMVSNDSLTAAPQDVSARSWWDVSGKISDVTSSVGAGIQSTLTKVIILVVIVAVIALFGMSYVQTKAAKLANQ